MATLFGIYLNKIGANKAKVGRRADITSARINDLCHKNTTKPSPQEFYKIIYVARHFAGLRDEDFYQAIEEIFPNRPKADLMEEFRHLPADIQLLKKHTQTQSYVEDKIGMAKGKISKLTSETTKDLLAVELICFIESMGLDVLETFKEIYGEISDLQEE